MLAARTARAVEALGDIPRDDAEGVPAELRAAWRVLKSAGCIPEELELRKSIVRLEDLLAACADDGDAARLRRTLEEKRLRYRLLMERRPPGSRRT